MARLPYVDATSTGATVGWQLQGQLVASPAISSCAPGELVLDQMAGSGTTLVECKLLGLRSVGVDINPDAVTVAPNMLDFSYAPLDAEYKAPEIKTYVGDARSLDLVESESVDLIATHPPYASIIPYSHDREGDLSSVQVREEV